MAERLTLPVLPMRETVVFPGVAVPISAGRPGTLEAIEKILDTEDRRLFAVCQRENEDDASPSVLYEMGVIVRVLQVQRGPSGLQLLIQGERRAKALSYEQKGAMIEADVWIIDAQEPKAPYEPALQALDRELRERAAELGRARGMPREALAQIVQGVQEPGAFADLVAFYLELPTAEKQALLELFPVAERMRRVLVGVERDLLRIDAQQEIQQKVQQELGEKQREMVLREQLRAIQKELGEDEDGSEIEELAERVAALELTEDARREVDRELNRLRRTNPQSAEYQVLRTYLELITELPWGTRTEDRIELAKAQRVLEEDHFGLEDVKDRVLEYLAVRKLQMERAAAEAAENARSASARKRENGGAPTEISIESTIPAEAGSPDAAEEPPLESEHDEEVRAKAKAVGRGPILLFVGPPGVGKTSIAKSIARALGRKYVRISLGGARDEADIRGHRRTYVGAMPGRIIQGLRQAGARNPVILLDEVDKLGVSLQGDPSAALLEVLDPAQNHTFVDHYLGIPFDLSEVLFVATANYREQIPAPLQDRMEFVSFAGYTELEKKEIARRYLLPRQREESGLSEAQITLTDAGLEKVISEYTREAGVRQLERELGKVARKVARRIAAGDVESVTVDAADVKPLLGHAKVHPERAALRDTIGTATGMFYTPMGGDIMFVEASVSHGKDNLILTGQLGDVMKESARAALTYAKTNAALLGIPEERLKEVDLHVHVPAGAIPKDGPSAGVTMATAMVSALAKRPVRNDVAMTGEITLTGRVLPIGGLKEKVLGAYRAGIREVILPRDNEPYLEDLPADVSAEMTFHAVEDLGEVLAIALRGASLREGAIVFSDRAAQYGGKGLHM